MDSTVQSMHDVAIAQITAPKLSTRPSANTDIDKTSKQFEGMFMSQMLQPMFDSMDVDPVFGGGHGEQVMRSFLVQEYGKIAAKSGHFGIASAVKNEMIKAQAAATTGNGGTNVIAN